MKYTIISLNDERKPYKDYIRRIVDGEEIEMPAVNGMTADLSTEAHNRGLSPSFWGNAKLGEIGVWLSNFDRWQLASGLDEPLIVFEDDAIPDAFFNDKLNELIGELPDDWDFVALWVPDNQRQDFLYDVKYNENGHPAFNGYVTPDKSVYRIPGASYAALVYQGYGMVSLMYSPSGGRKLVDLARTRGIDTTVDCWIFEEAHKGNLNGYAPRPEQASIVHYDWKAASHVQLTDRIK
jgi:GR25 family glycosyltransferase involved in LPS biosynthesis